MPSCKAVVVGPQLLFFKGIFPRTQRGVEYRMLQKVTALKYQKKNRQRVNVFLDGQYAFGLQASIAIGLRVGQALSPEEIAQLQDRDLAEVAYEGALGFLGYRPRSHAEVEAYLRRRKASPAVAQTVITRLTSAGLVDDDAFARYWVENRESFRPRGRRSLRFELRRKGVPDTVVDSATGEINEADSAYRAAHDRAQRLSSLDYAVFRRRLAGFLQRRGFYYEVVKETVDRLWRELHGSGEEESADSPGS
jgi:regulatory protein